MAYARRFFGLTSSSGPDAARRQVRWASIPVAVLALSGFTAVLTQSSPASAAAQIRVIDPAVEWRPAGTSEFAEVRQSVDAAMHSLVRTGPSGVAELAYGDGSLTRLGPGTSYEIATLQASSSRREIVGRLDVGQTFHRVSKVSGSNSRFEVHTSNAVAVVRGTEFGVSCPVRDVCEVAVTHGVVSVGTPEGKSVSVTAGTRVRIGADGRLGPLQSLSPTDDWIAGNTRDPDPSAPVVPATPSDEGQVAPAPAEAGKPSADAAPSPDAAESDSPAGDAAGYSSEQSGDPTVVDAPAPPKPLEIPLCPQGAGAGKAPTDAAKDSRCVPCESGEAGTHNPNCPSSLTPPVSPAPGGSGLPAPGRASPRNP